jgi:hypothetical protein
MMGTRKYRDSYREVQRPPGAAVIMGTFAACRVRAARRSRPTGACGFVLEEPGSDPPAVQ